ncbi:hypothetical protein ACWC9R_04095 [Streptomyces sp. NPDC001219]
MLHEIDDLRRERQRVEARPSPAEAPPVLSVCEAATSVDPRDYIRWLLHTAGAEEVSGPSLADASEWVREVPGR